MSREKGYDEVFCASCGEPIKKQAELCPHCGVRNQETNRTSSVEIDESNLTSRFKEINQSTDVDIDELFRYGSKALAWVFGIFFVLGGLGMLFSGVGIVGLIFSFVQGVIFIAIGAILLPPVRERITLEYPVTTVGWVRSTGEGIIRDVDEPCSVCYNSIDKGIARTYREQFVLFGAPLFTKDEGSNNYCQSCAGGEPSVDMTDKELNRA
jgi:RNA polymerase subunit RPABC4/transcription elongation factor Spt4